MNARRSDSALKLMEMGYILPPPSTAAEHTGCHRGQDDANKRLWTRVKGSMDCDNLKATRRNTQTALKWLSLVTPKILLLLTPSDFILITSDYILRQDWSHIELCVKYMSCIKKKPPSFPRASLFFIRRGDLFAMSRIFVTFLLLSTWRGFTLSCQWSGSLKITSCFLAQLENLVFFLVCNFHRILAVKEWAGCQWFSAAPCALETLAT